MTGDTHYDFEVLAELAEGLLDVTTAARVREHLAVCDSCGESLAELAAVREVLAAVPVPAMPMGVALRIDKALAAESESRTARGGLRLDEAPDWDRIMSDSPWETVPAATAPEPVLTPARSLQSVPQARPVPAAVAMAPAATVPPQAGPPPGTTPFGVVTDDGSVVPARSRPRKASRRRAWLMPVAASAAAAAVIGSVGLGSLLSASGEKPSGPSVALPAPVASTPERDPYQGPGRGLSSVDDGPTRNYAIGKSDFNYSDAVLDGPLATYVGATGPGSGGVTAVDTGVESCVSRIAAQVGRKLGVTKAPNPIGVDQGLYQGNEATVITFWKDRFRNSVWVYVVDGNCAALRKPAVGRWQ
ncbi:hypothetical protein GCM10009677_05400 [Sphaerisporangium rubeum]|uniref:Zinc-finger domain-containing protein n=1 Tax=Sphaerisporangium rubeum TaxID=321317 RepID=A0A7X0I8V8_9ACTN|nr:hypothetical protein [Sphaerisporangium rubeum]MBB6470618.1 hypothetical protein [Sphaerisporangium rubeum]